MRLRVRRIARLEDRSHATIGNGQQDKRKRRRSRWRYRRKLEVIGHLNRTTVVEGELASETIMYSYANGGPPWGMYLVGDAEVRTGSQRSRLGVAQVVDDGAVAKVRPVGT
jgi:hypothetical protein